MAALVLHKLFMSSFSQTIATALEAFTSHKLNLEDKRFLKGFYIYLGLLKPSAL